MTRQRSGHISCHLRQTRPFTPTISSPPPPGHDTRLGHPPTHERESHMILTIHASLPRGGGRNNDQPVYVDTTPPPGASRERTTCPGSASPASAYHPTPCDCPDMWGRIPMGQLGQNTKATPHPSHTILNAPKYDSGLTAPHIFGRPSFPSQS